MLIQPVDADECEDLDEGSSGHQHSVERDRVGEHDVVGVFFGEVELLVLITFV